MARPKLKEIEISVYGEGGLFDRVIAKIETLGSVKSAKITGKKYQQIDMYRRMHRNPENFDYRPKLDTIKDLAVKLGVE